MAVSDNTPTLEGYTYVSTLGKGGFADVHLYQQRFPRRKVAIKVLRVEELDSALRRQFVSEANVMARLSSHPAIATIFAADITAEGDPYLVMEYYARGSLGTGYRDAPLSVEDVLRHGVRIATALEHAHRGGVVHHDVKPANILLNDYGAAVLTDFGIAVGDEADGETTIMRASRASVESQTSAAGSHGVSVPWAPPEALADNPTSDARSDIYSLGATLYTLLEGRTPFEVSGASNGSLQLSRRIERGEVGAFEREAPEELRALLRSMMSTDPQARPASGQQVAETIQSIQREQGQAITPIELNAAAEESGQPESIPEADQFEPTVRRSDIEEVDVETRPRAPRPTGRSRRTIALTSERIWRDLSNFAQSKLLPGAKRLTTSAVARIGTLARDRSRWLRPRVLIISGGVIALIAAAGVLVAPHVRYVPTCDSSVMTALGENWGAVGFVWVTLDSITEDPVAQASTSLTCGATNGSSRLYIDTKFARADFKEALGTGWDCSVSQSDPNISLYCMRVQGVNKEIISVYNGILLRIDDRSVTSPTGHPVIWIRYYT